MVSNTDDEVCNICSVHFLWYLSNPTDNGVLEAWFSAETLGGRAFIREIVQCVPLNLVDIWGRLHYIERYVDCCPTLFFRRRLYLLYSYSRTATTMQVPSFTHQMDGLVLGVALYPRVSGASDSTLFRMIPSQDK